MSRIYSAVPSQRVSIGVTSNKRHVKSPATRLFVQQFIQAYHKGQIKALHFWFIVRKIRWQMESLRKRPAIQEAFACVLTTRQQRKHQSYWYIFYTLTHWEILVQVLRIGMARLPIERNKSRRNSWTKFVLTLIWDTIAHATVLQWCITFETGPCLKVWKAFAFLGRAN